MNGRLYDPLLGRFLSPDNYVHMPDFSQNFNRYSYALNNPLIYTDPEGELLEWVLLAVGAYLGGAKANEDEQRKWQFNPTKWEPNFKTFGYIVGGAAVGYMGGAAIEGLFAGITTLNAGLTYENLASVFAEINLAGTGTMLEGVGYATAAGGGLYLTASALNNFFKNHLIFDSEFRIDYGPQIQLQGKALGTKLGFSAEKETNPLAQLNFGYNEGLYGYGYSFDNPHYGYGGVKNPIRTSISGGIAILGGEQTFYPHRKLVKVRPLKSESINATVLNISKIYDYSGNVTEKQFTFDFGFDFSLFFGVSGNYRFGFKY